MEKTITKEELNQLPLKHFEGRVDVIEDINIIEELVKELEKHDTIGFDTETKPSFQKGKVNQVALLQLATNEKAYLFRLNKTGFHPSLVRLLSNPQIKKVGVGIRDDIRGLNRLVPFKQAGFIEIQDHVKGVGIEDTSLKKLAGLVLNFRVSKRQRLSNWEAPHLSEGQILYAATDAWVAIELLNKLQEEFPHAQAQTI
ncbi:3'-5' exonuclease domain-containing protein 2 [Carboxylicivirga sediminis]|uniref:3'-5' exonuclease n=1 Tax=Carboxylicivirga sediminis TaxID=2006564 RepID=A0A941F4I0_9BACT|nr:3'-5' exonuclease [Carboxylicivirga sediminis]MBR8536287.1 3'-5' exonuclease domain-containing protein 2 [Carboxylicivirga sediminis]